MNVGARSGALTGVAHIAEGNRGAGGSHQSSGCGARIIHILSISVILCLTVSCVTMSSLGGRSGRATSEPQPAQSFGLEPPTIADVVRDYYEGAFDAGVAIARSLVAARPTDTESLKQLQFLDEESGNYVDAVAIIDRRRTLESDDGALVLDRFIDLCLGGQLSAADAMLPLPDALSREPDALLFRGLLAIEEGRPADAREALRDLVSIDDSRPMAWLLLGSVDMLGGDAEAAEKDYAQVMSLDPNITAALEPYAEALLAQKKTERAYSVLLRARNALADPAQADRMLQTLTAEHPDLAASHAATTATKRRDYIPPIVEAPAAAAAQSRIVRIGLAEGLGSVSAKAGGDFRLSGTVVGEPVYASGTRGAILSIERTQDGLLVRNGASYLLATTGIARLQYDDQSDTTAIFDLLTDKGMFFAATEDRAYRGEIDFIPTRGGITVVNRLPLEEYLYSVLPSEMPAYWPAQALEAQAVAARSYTLATLGRYEDRGYDLQGSVVSAAYRGATNESPATTRAVDATRGISLTFDGKPLEAFYGANSGGYTENSTAVWGESDGMAAVADAKVAPRTEDLPMAELAAWLNSRPPAYCAVSPYYSRFAYRWVKWVSADDIARRVNKNADIGTILRIVTAGRGISGRVSAVRVVGTRGTTEITGDAVRAQLGGLRSTLFTVRPLLDGTGAPTYFIFTGGGWGHGVGMDQSGAAGMAAAGYTFLDILSHYYPKAHIEEERDATVEPER